LIILSRT